MKFTILKGFENEGEIGRIFDSKELGLLLENGNEVKDVLFLNDDDVDMRGPNVLLLFIYSHFG